MKSQNLKQKLKFQALFFKISGGKKSFLLEFNIIFLLMDHFKKYLPFPIRIDSTDKKTAKFNPLSHIHHNQIMIM